MRGNGQREYAWRTPRLAFECAAQAFAKLKNTPKPKPPQPPPSNDTADGNGTAAGKKGDKKAEKAAKAASDEAAKEKAEVCSASPQRVLCTPSILFPSWRLAPGRLCGVLP